MFNNNLYNLMMQLTEEHKSLWRINSDYIKDAAKSPATKKFWQALAKDKEAHIKELSLLIKKELK